MYELQHHLTLRIHQRLIHHLKHWLLLLRILRCFRRRRLLNVGMRSLCLRSRLSQQILQKRFLSQYR